MTTGGWSDDYYELLGVDARADGAGLRRAWRRLALRWHPDRGGPGTKATFQMLLAAYRVLADPVARAAYDRQRRRSAPAVMLRRLSGPLSALLACGVARQAEEGLFDLYLTAAEISQGGMVAIPMRVPVHCPACAADREGPCARCEGTRAVDELFSAWLAVPPGVAEGTILEPSALLDGMVQPVAFRVRLSTLAA